MPFIMNEDKALKAKLSGITVADSGNPTRPVGVWFGQPDKEIRYQSYPYITIDLIAVNVDKEREHRGDVVLSYTPEGYNPNEEYRTYFPIPINLDYQVATWSRQPRHDRQIMAELFKTDRLPFRFGGVVVEEDNTIRRLDLLSFAKRDTTDQDGKRLFNNLYTVRISSEMLPYPLAQLQYQVTQNPNISFTYQNTPFTVINS